MTRKGATLSRRSTTASRRKTTSSSTRSRPSGQTRTMTRSEAGRKGAEARWGRSISTSRARASVSRSSTSRTTSSKRQSPAKRTQSRSASTVSRSQGLSRNQAQLGHGRSSREIAGRRAAEARWGRPNEEQMGQWGRNYGNQELMNRAETRRSQMGRGNLRNEERYGNRNMRQQDLRSNMQSPWSNRGFEQEMEGNPREELYGFYFEEDENQNNRFRR